MRMETKIVTHARVKAGPQLGDMIDMRILVLCPDRRDPNLLALRNIMDHIGIRYEVCATSETDLTRDRLWQGTHARYQGVILSTGYLAAWNSALTDWYDPLDDDELLRHPLGGDVPELLSGCHHGGQGAALDHEAQLGREAQRPEDAQRVLPHAGFGVAHGADEARPTQCKPSGALTSLHPHG